MTNDNTSRNINDEETTIRQDIKNRNIASACMLNIVLLLSLFVISTPNNSINSTTYNCTNINFTDIDKLEGVVMDNNIFPSHFLGLICGKRIYFFFNFFSRFW